MIACYRCGERERVSGSYCRPCRSAVSRKYYETHRDEHLAKNRERYAASDDRWRKTLQYKYGITASEYEQLLATQRGVCAICGEPADARTKKTKRLSVDHDHATGLVRGLLCAHCNRLLGDALDDPVRLRAAAAYLEAQT